jgi:hypothetical protein
MGRPIEDIIRESIEYNEVTGQFFWKKERPADHFSTPKSMKRWLTLFAGKEIKGTCQYGNTLYLNIRVCDSKFKAHRVAWLLFHGNWPVGDIDHIDGDGLNNRIDNLRDVSRQLNTRNSRLSSNNTTGVNGVTFRKDTNKWMARGSKILDNKHIRPYLGQFDSKAEAELARKVWEDSQGNFTERHGK